MEALGLNNHAALGDFLCDLISAVRSHEQLVKREDEINRDLHLEYIQKVKQGLLRVNSGTWKEFQETFNKVTLDTLMALSEGTSRFWKEENIPEEDLASLQSDVEDLINKVMESDLEDQLRRVLIDGLETVRHALVGYRIFGAEGIREAWDRNVGSFLRYREGIKRASQGEVFRRWEDLLGKINHILENGLKIKRLADPITRLMLGGGGE